ncbi:MAG: hypothetical protein ABIP49_03000 [Lysobacterales bacterium]
MKIFRTQMMVATAALVVSMAATAQGSSVQARPVSFDTSVVSGLGARNIGSAQMSGRISAIDAINTPDGKITLYVGAASGGVWKSLDGGTTFKPVFDDQPVQSIGAVAIDRKNPRTLWVGTGESWTRNSVSVGDGVYKSTDGGDTWQNMGLRESERITRIVIDPNNSDRVFACVPGKLWSDSRERGLYRTDDGGRNWKLVLKGANASTGCGDVSVDKKNSSVMFASLWDFRRRGWTFRSGGETPTDASGSGLHRSADGGNTWSEVTTDGNAGFPAKPYGRIAVTVAPSDSKIVYAMVESTRSALLRSGDGGKTWEERDRSQSMVWRPFYFARIEVDPKNPDRLFKHNNRLIASEDGGKSFSNVSGGAHGDFHDLWINPLNTQHVIAGDDGGLWISFDGASRWWKGNNLPISQFYHVSVDDKDPYQVYGGLQDNSSWVGDSAYPGGISNSRWENLYGGDGFWTFSDPSDPEYAYAEYQGGNISRINRRTLESRAIQPQGDFGEKLRWNWNAPIHLSPNEKGAIYVGSQFLFRSSDHGQSWTRLSPDLTTNDKSKQLQEQSGGVTVDNSSAEMHTTIYSISESPKDAKVIWVGTDDGNLQVTRDGGANWVNVAGNVRGVPSASWVSWIEASRFDPAVAYVTFDRHTFGDMGTHVYRTADYGRTWKALITANTPGVRGYAHVVREDVENPDLLFVGTEFGLWISPDRGGSWAEFKGGNFPAVAVRDIVQHPRTHDLVLATHGRGIWIVDDVTPLRGLKRSQLDDEVVLLPSRPVQQRIQGNGGWADGDAVFAGGNPPNGAVISYYQRSRHLFGKMKLEILGADGRVIDTLPASKRRGLNRAVWNMQLDPPRVPPAASLAFAGTQGPRVLPGTYKIRLTKNGKTYEQPLVIELDRRAKFSIEDRKAQFDASMRAHALFERMSGLVDGINALRMVTSRMAAGLPEGDPIRVEVAGITAKADAIRKKVVATTEGGAITGEERIRELADNIYGSVVGYEGRPGDYQIARIGVLERELDEVQKEFSALVANDVNRVNGKLAAKGLPLIPTRSQAPG